MFNVPGWEKPLSWQSPAAYIQSNVTGGHLKGEWYGCPPHDFYLGVMCSYFTKGGPNRHDTIITFNYDTVVEDNLRNLGMTPDYGLPEAMIEYVGLEDRANDDNKARMVEVLKLHGSVNWSALWPEQHERLWRRLIEVKLPVPDAESRVVASALQELREFQFRDSPIRRVRVYRDYASLRQDNRWGADSLFLVPPTWHKRFGGYLDTVWDRAVSALRKATRIVILGYSIPNTDLHFRYLLAAGLQDNISLRKIFFVNPGVKDEKTKAQLQERLLGLFRREHFDEGVIEVVPADTREFFAGPRALNEESFRVAIGRPLNPPGYTFGSGSPPWTFVSPVGNTMSIA
jgi:hypothetical protein